jgi:hypothetical protein
MNHPNKSLRTLLTGLCAISALVAFWEFYQFVQFRNQSGGVEPLGSTSSLWIAVVAAVVACLAGAYVVFSTVNHSDEDVMHITS